MKKVICLILSIVTVIGIIPMGTLAEERPFPDVPADAWYTEYIVEAHEMGIMQGDGKGNMMPTKPITRAEAVTIIRNHSKRVYDYPDVTEIPFTDVKKSDWFYEAVKWAYCEGFVLGVGNNKFKPNDYVTRQDFAVMINRYYNFKYFFELIETTAEYMVNVYTQCYLKNDHNSISEYAKEAMDYLAAKLYIYRYGSPGGYSAYQEPIIGGNNDNLYPLSYCSRSEAAKILVDVTESYVISYVYNDLCVKFVDVPYGVSTVYGIYYSRFDIFTDWGLEYEYNKDTLYLDGSQYITRAELAKLSHNRLSVNIYDEFSFSDYKNVFAEYAYRNGYMLPKSNGLFSPNDYVTVEEAIYFLNHVKYISNCTVKIDNSSKYSDWNEVSPEYAEAVRLAVSELTNGEKPYFIPTEEGKINPKRNITRLEFFRMFSN